jgi:putative phage-type endonuclease
MLTKEQLAERKNYLGASEIAAVMGISQFKTPLQVYAEKVGLIEPPDLSDIEAVEIGSDLEDYVAKKFEKKSGFKVRRDNRDFKHKQYPYIVGHLDRWILSEDALLECKTTSAWNAKKWKDEEMPREYIAQINVYCGLVGKSIGYVACLIGGQKFAWKKVKFDSKLFEKQVEAAKNFWEKNVLAKVAPLATEGDTELLGELFAGSDATETLHFDAEMSERVNAVIEARQGGTQSMKEAKEELESLSNQLKQLLGEYAVAATNMYNVTWKPQRVAPFVDTDKMKEDGIYEKYEVFNQSRVLRTNPIKKGK